MNGIDSFFCDILIVLPKTMSSIFITRRNFLVFFYLTLLNSKVHLDSNLLNISLHFPLGYYTLDISIAISFNARCLFLLGLQGGVLIKICKALKI